MRWNYDPTEVIRKAAVDWSKAGISAKSLSCLIYGNILIVLKQGFEETNL